MVADEVLKRDEERRRRRDEGQEDEEMEDAKDGQMVTGAESSRKNGAGDEKPKLVARTRVSQLEEARICKADLIASLHGY